MMDNSISKAIPSIFIIFSITITIAIGSNILITSNRSSELETLNKKIELANLPQLPITEIGNIELLY